jgi:hypothetical protein
MQDPLCGLLEQQVARVELGPAQLEVGRGVPSRDDEHMQGRHFVQVQQRHWQAVLQHDPLARLAERALGLAVSVGLDQVGKSVSSRSCFVAFRRCPVVEH